LLRAGTYPKGDNLKRHVDPRTYGYIRRFFALANVPEEVLEAARLDGAGAWQTFWRIKLPLLKEVIFVSLLICFTGAFKAFDLFWVLLPNQDHTSIVSTLLVKEVIKFDNPGYGSTLAVILTVLVLFTVALIMGAKNLWLRRGRRRSQ